MPTGRPHTTKCPKCKRGKYGYREIIAGVEHTCTVRKLDHKKAQTFLRCRDCGHSWWSTIPHIPHRWQLAPGVYTMDLLQSTFAKMFTRKA